MTDDSFEVVYQASTELDANICKTILEEAGITVVILPVDEAWKQLYLGEMGSAFGQLLVPAEDVDRAKALLAEYIQQLESGAFALEDEEEAE